MMISVCMIDKIVVKLSQSMIIYAHKITNFTP